MSDSARDPYVGLLSEMRAQARNAAPAGMCLGEVKAIGQHALQVQTDTGLMLDADDLMINPLYAYDAGEELSIETSAGKETHLAVNQTISCLLQFQLDATQITVNQITLYDVPGKLTGTIKVRVQLKIGDRVILLPSADGQTYYLLSKVVGV